MADFLLWIEAHLPMIISYILIGAQYLQYFFTVLFVKKDNNLLKAILRNEVKGMSIKLKDTEDRVERIIQRMEQVETRLIERQKELDSKYTELIKLCDNEIYSEEDTNLNNKAFATQILNIIQPRQNKPDRED